VDHQRTVVTTAASLPAAAVVEGFEYRLKTSRAPPIPCSSAFATAPVVFEQEPNNKPAQAQRIVPPCEIAGQFFSRQRSGLVHIRCKERRSVLDRGFLAPLGLPTDPFVVVQRVTRNDKGDEQNSDVLELYDQDTNLGDREFNTTTRDPAARFEVSADGVYRLQVRDLFNRVVAVLAMSTD